MRLAMGTREVLDAEGLVRTYVTPHKRGLRYAYPYYDGLVTNGDPATLCTGDLLSPTMLGVNLSLDRMHTLTALLPLLQRGLDALPPVDLVEADEETDTTKGTARPREAAEGAPVGTAQAGVLPPLASTVKRTARWAMRDFLFAAWFLWMTPLLAALSSSRPASRRRSSAAAVSPDSRVSR